MGVLTIPLNETEELNVAKVMKKYSIATKTGAMRYATKIVLNLEDDLEQLKKEKKELQARLDSYKQSSSMLLEGISGLLKLNNTKF